MPSLANALREKLHPVHQLRRVSVVRHALLRVDVPVWARVQGMRDEVRVRLIRDLSYRLLPGGPEPHITALVRTIFEVVRPRTFWDIGAYFGYYGLLAASCDRDVSVVFCEPDARNAQLIDQTLRRWALTDARVLQLAMSDRNGVASFTSDPISGATGSLDAEKSAAHQLWGESKAIDVRTLKLDTATANDRVDMMKIDVEGHEEAVIRGAHETINRFRPLIVFECFHGGDEICAHLAGLGYEVFDAELLAVPSSRTSNFFCLPSEQAHHREALLAGWRSRVADWR